MPLISVVIPAYNAEKTIRETVECVLVQTLTDFELLVINSSSTDRTSEVLQEISDSRLRVINLSRGSASLNRNHGLSQARGKFITFLDSDDLWTPDKLESQHLALQRNLQATVAYSFTDCIDQNNHFLHVGSHADWSGDVFAPLLLSNFIASGSNLMVYTDVIRSLGGFDESLSNCEDLDICLRLAVQHEFIPVCRVQVLYRVMPMSKSSNLKGLERSALKILHWAYLHPRARTLQHLKAESHLKLYEFLIHKALLPPRDFKTLSLACKCFVQCLVWRPTYLFDISSTKLLVKLVVKSVLSHNLWVKLLKR
jgi:glycosyltransferase involved in cell wall biosynthesis